jgi:hypothetical protein
LTPGFQGTQVSAGQIFAFSPEWEKTRVQKSKKLPQFKGSVLNPMTVSDPII